MILNSFKIWHERNSIESKINNFEFTKQHTNICKGIAILFMILHHSVGMYYNNFDLSWYAQNSKSVGYLILLFFSTAGKVCVSLLTILSGYGLAKSFSKIESNTGFIQDIKFIISRYVKLYSIYLPIVFAITITRILCSVLWKNSLDMAVQLKYILFDLSMICRISINDWYLTAIIILYFLFPMLYRLIRENSTTIIILTAVPWVIRALFNVTNFKFDSFWSCLLPFSLGICFEQKNVLHRFKLNNPELCVILPSICVVSAFVLRLIFSLPMDVFFALSIIFFEINVLSMQKYIDSVLNCLGKNSANMWLLHGSLLPLIVCGNPVFKFILVTLISLLISFVIEKTKAVTGYNKIFLRLRNYLK